MSHFGGLVIFIKKKNVTNMNRKWTYELCYEEAKKYITRNEFRKKDGAAYRQAVRKKWLDDYTWFPPCQKLHENGYWCYETCYEEAKKYITRNEFEQNTPSAYEKARKNNWLDDYTWFEKSHQSHPSGYWCYETCYEEAKKYTTRSDFQNGNTTAYEAARKNNWLDDYTWFKELKKKNGYWCYETCYEEAKKYTTRSDFHKAAGAAYIKALKNDWINEYTWMPNQRLSTTTCHFVYRYYFPENNSVYVGRTNNIYKRNQQHISNDGTIKKYAENYSFNIPPMEMMYSGLTAMESLELEDKLVQEYKSKGFIIINKAKTGINCGSLGKFNIGKWNYDACLKIAESCTKRAEMERKNASAYHSARRNGWLDDFFGKKVK